MNGHHAGTVLLLATVDTKREEIAFFTDVLRERGVATRIIDISLDSKGEVCLPKDADHHLAI